MGSKMALEVYKVNGELREGCTIQHSYFTAERKYRKKWPMKEVAEMSQSLTDNPLNFERKNVGKV